MKLHPDFKAKVDAMLQKHDEHSESTSHDLSDSVELEELKLSEAQQRSRLHITKDNNRRAGRIKKRRKKDKDKKKMQKDAEVEDIENESGKTDEVVISTGGSNVL
jgi:hypothetical protein